MRIHTNDLISAFSFPIDALLFSEMHWVFKVIVSVLYAEYLAAYLSNITLTLLQMSFISDFSYIFPNS